MLGSRELLLLISSMAKIIVWTKRNSLKLILENLSKKAVRVCVTYFMRAESRQHAVPGTRERFWGVREGKRGYCDLAINGEGSSDGDISFLRQQGKFRAPQHAADRSFFLGPKGSKGSHHDKHKQQHYTHAVTHLEQAGTQMHTQTCRMWSVLSLTTGAPFNGQSFVIQQMMRRSFYQVHQSDEVTLRLLLGFLTHSCKL